MYYTVQSWLMWQSTNVTLLVHFCTIAHCILAISIYVYLNKGLQARLLFTTVLDVISYYSMYVHHDDKSLSSYIKQQTIWQLS